MVGEFAPAFIFFGLLAALGVALYTWPVESYNLMQRIKRRFKK